MKSIITTFLFTYVTLFPLTAMEVSKKNPYIVQKSVTNKKKIWVVTGIMTLCVSGFVFLAYYIVRNKFDKKKYPVLENALQGSYSKFFDSLSDDSSKLEDFKDGYTLYKDEFMQVEDQIEAAKKFIIERRTEFEKKTKEACSIIEEIIGIASSNEYATTYRLAVIYGAYQLVKEGTIPQEHHQYLCDELLKIIPKKIFQ